MPATPAAQLDTAALRQFILGLAEGMIAAEDSVDYIHETLGQVARAYGADDVEFVILPTLILVETGSGETERLALRTSRPGGLRFDQIAALYDLIEQARSGSIDPRDGIGRLNEIGASRPRHGWVVRVLGHALLTAGLSLLLAPTWEGVLIAFGLGAVLGLAKLIRSPTLQLVFPVVAAFVSGVVVFLLAPHVPMGDPVRLMIAPLATFLPGGVLTTATMELAARQMVAGSSRLVTGLVQLGLLSFGIIAAGTVVGVASTTYVPLVTTEGFPWWTAVLGVLLFAVGNFLHFSAPGRTFGWILLVLLVAYAGQSIGSVLVGATISGFVGAAVMTPLVLWIGTLKHGAPTQLTFLPAFWLLVPGAAGLVGLTEAVGSGASLEDFADALTSIMSIALGVLIGTAVYRFAKHGAAEVASFHIDVPALREEEEPPLWARFVPGTPRSFWGRARREASTSPSEDDN
ncbi:threonine/serine exporter ThrE family protein [Agromyces sp. MMS24-K17]|uniref:threonine/serine ThrE exporter family protein n=1 Tax=Agromyces sp. MMS24-K17 TaxID=3372850 RepID=UPI0037551BAF